MRAISSWLWPEQQFRLFEAIHFNQPTPDKCVKPNARQLSESHQRYHDTIVYRSPRMTGITSCVVSARNAISVPGSPSTSVRREGSKFGA